MNFLQLKLLCANPHSHVRATTREAARPQPQDSEDATGYWAADSLSSSLPISPFPPMHLLCLLVTLMGIPLKTCSHVLPGLLVAFAVFTAHGHRYRWTMAHVHLNSPANT